MTLLARIKKIESTLLDTSVGAVLLREPPVDADDDTRNTFESEVREVLESGRKVIVRSNGQDRLRRPGVEYYDDDFSAGLALAASTPDPEHGDRLRAILAKCRNTPLPVVKEVNLDAEI